MLRFIRFRLRTLLVFMSATGAICGWLVMHKMEHRRELELINEIVGEREAPSTRFSFNDENVAALVYDHSFFG